MLIARDIDRGAARPFGPAAVPARLTSLLQPRRCERPIPMTSNRCVARGSMVMRRRRLPYNRDGHEGRCGGVGPGHHGMPIKKSS
jgi:hypothetical protein